MFGIWGWGTRARYTIIPDALEIIYKNDDGCEAVKMAMRRGNYDLGENEYFPDDLEEEQDWRHRVN